MILCLMSSRTYVPTIIESLASHDLPDHTPSLLTKYVMVFRFLQVVLNNLQ